ncbi:MAG TPA: DUF1194 domain-containing protein [Candidatus Cybelea sp.]|nr:DUF1194 domain-containing protein [Candidatus Cybelea sp.]
MRRAVVVVFSALFFGVFAHPAGAAERVDLALILAADVSRSIDQQEFELQRKGYAAAFTSNRVLAAIAAQPHQSIVVCLVEWSGLGDQKVVVDWTIVRDRGTGEAFASAILEAPRPFAAFTSISAGIDFAMKQFANAGVDAERRVIDVSGDGTNNSGRPVTDARDDAVAAGVTINGLAIINKHPVPGYYEHTQPTEGLAEYYRRNVIGGPGAFHLVIENFSSFADAVQSKLIREIAESRPTHPAWRAEGPRPARDN